MGGPGSGRFPKKPTLDGSGQVSEKLITNELVKQLRENPDEENPRRRTKAARIAENLMRYALGEGKGCPPSLKAMAEVWNRAEGTPLQSIGLTVKSPEEQANRIHELLNNLAQVKQLEDMGNDGTVN